jgi:hypothetical protein
MMTRERVNIEAELARSFALSQTDAEELATAPENFIPKFAARIVQTTLMATLAHIQNFVPTMAMNQFAQVQQYQTATNDVRERFHAKWPQIPRATHDKRIGEISRAVRQANPQATTDFMMDIVGRILVAELNLGPTAPPVAPAAPARTSTPAFVPASPGNRQMAPPVRQPGEWDGLLDSQFDE